MIEYISKEPITKGWSGDKKYCVTTADGRKYLLRVSPPEQYERKKNEFDMMKRVAALGVPMCQPIEFGTCDEGVYSLQSWIDGVDAEEMLPSLSDTEQYELGIKAGKILRTMHTISVSPPSDEWESIYSCRLNTYIDNYMNCGMRFAGDKLVLDYIHSARHLLKNRPMCFAHGDYHVGNLMISPDKSLTVIDFNRYRIAEPYQSFGSIVFSARVSPLFASGQINGYFDKNIPQVFWKLMKLYLSAVAINGLPWSIPYGKEKIEFSYKQINDILSWYDNMKNPVPTWYFKGYYLQYIDGIPYKLKSEYNFDFIHKYGKVFKIFDDQDSGNICFGTEKDGERYFVKFAGAPTEQYDGNPADAVARLKATAPIYEALHHKNLIEYVGSEELGDGFAMIFKWADGECMGRMYPASRKKFMAMPTETRLDVFRDILSFFEYVASAGYVAIDFYDGSIMYDFEKNHTTICDIDFYRKMPCKNDMGRMWGSSRFMSPEEFQLGATLDERTNVYTAGATAFALFANYNREREAWLLSDELYEIALKAVSDKREERSVSIRQFIDEW